MTRPRHPPQLIEGWYALDLPTAERAVAEHHAHLSVVLGEANSENPPAALKHLDATALVQVPQTHRAAPIAGNRASSVVSKGERRNPAARRIILEEAQKPTIPNVPESQFGTIFAGKRVLAVWGDGDDPGSARSVKATKATPEGKRPEAELVPHRITCNSVRAVGSDCDALENGGPAIEDAQPDTGFDVPKGQGLAAGKRESAVRAHGKAFDSVALEDPDALSRIQRPQSQGAVIRSRKRSHTIRQECHGPSPLAVSAEALDKRAGGAVPKLDATLSVTRKNACAVAI